MAKRKRVKSGTPVLSPEQYQWAMEQYAAGLKTQVQLAKHFGISQPAISNMLRGITYKGARV